MARTWQPAQSKQFARQLQLGKPYYVTMPVARNRAPYEDSRLASTHTFTKRLPLTGTPCTDYGSDAETICRLYGPISDTPPRGVRNIADPTPQVGAPLGSDYRGYLDEAELDGLDKRVRESSDPHTRQRLGRRR